MTYASYIADRVVDRVSAAQRDLRQAELDVRPYVGSALALDSAVAVYRHALVEGCGIAERDLRGLDARALRTVLRHQPVPGSAAARNAPMAFELVCKRQPGARRDPQGHPAPRDISTRNDFRS